MANRKPHKAGALLIAMAMTAGASGVPVLAAETPPDPPELLEESGRPESQPEATGESSGQEAQEEQGERTPAEPEEAAPTDSVPSPAPGPAEPAPAAPELPEQEEPEREEPEQAMEAVPQAAVSADQVKVSIPKNYSAPKSLLAGEQTQYSLSVKNSGAAAATVRVTLTFGPGVAEAVWQVQSGGTLTAPFDPETRSMTLRLSVPKNRTVTQKITTVAGTEGVLSMAVQAVLEDTGEPLSVSGSAAESSVSRYATLKDLRLAGANLGYYHAAGVNPSYTVVDSRTVSGGCLDGLEGAVFSFDGAFAGCGLAPHVDAAGQAVNADSGRKWQCVGFVPYAGSSDVGNNRKNLEELERFVFVEEETADFGTAGTGLEAAKSFVTAQGGVLYGETAGPEAIQALVRAAEQGQGRATIMTVWHLSRVREYRGDYENMAFPARRAVAYAENSPGVTVQAGEVTQTKENGTTYFNNEILITLEAALPDRANINLTQALGEAMVRSNETFRRNLPGDTMRYHIRLTDHSGAEYRYTPGSAAIGTVPSAGPEEESLGTGFEGYPIGSEGLYCPIPRRLWNSALRALGAQENALDDDSLGVLLKARGYGSAEDSDGAVTRASLGRYYFDWYNSKRPAGEELTAFSQLTGQELAQLTNGRNGSYVLETCPDVAGAYYGFFYRDIYTFDGLGLYDRMAENGQKDSYAETLALRLLQPEEDQDRETVLSTHIDGPLTGNGFQMTRMGFGLQFGLSRIYQVTYDYNRGDPEQDQFLDGKYPSGDQVTVRPNPTWEGHVFTGWTVTTDNPAAETPAVGAETETFLMPAANVHLVAQWKVPDPEPTPDPKPDPDPDPDPDPGPDEPTPTPDPDPAPDPEPEPTPVPDPDPVPAQPAEPPEETPPAEQPPEPPAEEEPPAAPVPETGDTIGLWAALSGLSSAGLGLLTWWRRR